MNRAKGTRRFEADRFAIGVFWRSDLENTSCVDDRNLIGVNQGFARIMSDQQSRDLRGAGLSIIRRCALLIELDRDS